MVKNICFKMIVFIVAMVLLQNCSAKPLRVKRVSDQRLAELETLLALSKMSGRLVTVPLAFGKVDPARIGRRRRSESGLMERLFIFNHSQEDAGPYNEDLERIFEED